MVQITTPPKHLSVYGPVQSWRYGSSLGIDPVGPVSVCSFNCVYCQLGEIQNLTAERQIFVPTEKILEDLGQFNLEGVDLITCSGSGEPTLALNIGEILSRLKELTGKPTLVLTNGTLLSQSEVREDLQAADLVSVKLDAVDDDQLRRINRPVSGLNWSKIWEGIKQFSNEYRGRLAIQTMVLTPPTPEHFQAYVQLVKQLKVEEIQLNTPKRPKPLKYYPEARGNHSLHRPYPVQVFKCVSQTVIEELAGKINQATGVPVRFPH